MDFKKWFTRKLAYHTTDAHRLATIMQQGLMPQTFMGTSKASLTFRGQKVLFFCDNPNAYKPMSDEIQFAFPWPDDAQLFEIVDGIKEYITHTPIPANKLKRIG